MSAARRPEDMSPDGWLELLQQDDGDIIVTVKEGREPGCPPTPSASVEFCLSGGHSPWTLVALRELMAAMAKDERREPWPPREEEPECPGPDCVRCTGEYCDLHITAPCDCDCDERHSV